MHQGLPPFDCQTGRPHYRGVEVHRRTVTIGGRVFEIAGLKDAAELLDQPDFAQRFLEADIAPYGLELWPAAIALAAHLSEYEEGQGRSAVELGCGLGLVSVAAAFKGWQITATDNEPAALRFAQYNASVNGADIAGFAALDWRCPPTDRPYHLVLGADVLYQASDHLPILQCIGNLLGTGGIVMLADPYRGVADAFHAKACAYGFDVELVLANVPTSPTTQACRIFNLRRGARHV